MLAVDFIRDLKRRLTEPSGNDIVTCVCGKAFLFAGDRDEHKREACPMHVGKGSIVLADRWPNAS